MISVIVPVYNCEKYLGKCLDSLIRQTYRDLEIVLVIDGATDASKEICEAYQKTDNRILIFEKENSGVSDTRNLGIEKANGEYIAFVDSDDYIAADMYEKLYHEAERSRADLVFCNFYVNRNGTVEPKAEPALKSFADTRSPEYFFYFGNKQKMNIMGAIWRVLFKRSAIGNVRFDPALRIAEDLNFLLKVTDKAGVIRVVEEALYYYRLEDGFLRKYYDGNFYSVYKQSAEANIAFIEDRRFEKLYRAYLFHIYTQVVCSEIEFNLEYRKNLKRYLKDPFYVEAAKGKNLLEYRKYCCNLKQRIKGFLLYIRAFGLLKLLLK